MFLTLFNFVAYANLFLIVLFCVKKLDLYNVFYGSFQLVVVLFFVYFILLLKGVNKMVDVITNRMFDTISRFSPRDGPQNESLASLKTLQRFARDRNYKKKILYRDEIKDRESLLYNIKENAVDVDVPVKRPLQGLSCQYCTATSRERLVNKATEKYALNNILDNSSSVQNRNFLHRTFNHLSQVYVLKKYHYPQVTDLVLKDERLKHAIEKTTLQQFQDADHSDDDFYQQLLKSNQQRAKKLLFGMRSTLSDFLLRFTSWVLYKLLPCFLTCIAAHPGQIEMLKEASTNGYPLIFLPLHRSHLDYILISLILLNNNVRSPLVAAGDNLRIPFFGSLLRGLGAFFIKRRIDPIMGRKDHLYKAVLHTYMNECLRAGHNMEFFLEGGRTRTGKPCMPKYGILSIIVEAFMDGTIEDALLVPVSVNYEKLVDGNFIREQLGKPKEMESFGGAIKSIWQVLNSDYGMMRIDFNQPFSLRELVNTFNTSGKVPKNGLKMRELKSNPSTSSLYGTDVVSDEHKSLVESISKHIIYDCAQSTSIMSTNALAFLLLTRFREGATIDQLVAALDTLRADLSESRKDLGFTGDSLDVITYGVELLGPGLVRKEKDVIKPLAVLPNVIELTYYSNTLVTHYALDSLIAIGINTLRNPTGFHRETLIEAILELCNIFQYEFIFCKPCQTLEDVVTTCMGDLALQKQLFIPDKEQTEKMLKSQRLARQFDDDDDGEVGFVKPKLLNETAQVEDFLEHSAAILMPLVETYATSAYALEKLVGRTLLESELIETILTEMRTQLAEGRLKYEESVSVDPVKNALKLFQKWDVLECHSEKKLRLYYLKENHDNVESIKTLHNRIDHFRTSSRV